MNEYGHELSMGLSMGSSLSLSLSLRYRERGMRYKIMVCHSVSFL